jgi:hypothetical protein
VIYSDCVPKADGGNSDRSETNMQKRVKQSAVGTMVAETRTIERSSPATKTQQVRNDKSKEVVCGAKLTISTSQEVYHQTSPGHSVSQELIGTPVASWVDERQLVGMQGGVGSEVPQQIGQHDTESDRAEGEELFRIPARLDERQHLMLQTTQADLERQAVEDIKCKLCPNTRFSGWDDFERHCDTSEKHPLTICFCDRCGVYFGRKDSLRRHIQTDTKACRDTTEDQAALRRRVTEKLFKDFNVKLDRCLRTGEDVGQRFAEIVNLNRILQGSTKKNFKRKDRF